MNCSRFAADLPPKENHNLPEEACNSVKPFTDCAQPTYQCQMNNLVCSFSTNNICKS